MSETVSVVQGGATQISAAWQRVSVATAANQKAQTDLKFALDLVKATAGEDAEAMEWLATAQKQAATASLELAAAQNNANAGLRDVGYSATEARHALMGTGEMIGVHLPRFIASFVAHSETIGPILSAAFSTVAIVGMITILPELISKIGESATAMGGFGEAAKKAYDEALAANSRMITSSLELTEKYRELHSVGLSGSGKMTEDQRENAAALKETANALAQESRQLQAAQDELKAHTTGWANWKGITWNTIDGTADRIDRLKATITNSTPVVEELRKKLDELKLSGAKLPIEASVEERNLREQVEGANIEAHQRAELAKIGLDVEYYKELKSLGMISSEDELTRLKTDEQKRYEIQRQALASQASLAKEKAKAEGSPANANPELTRIAGEEEAAASEHQQKLNAIETAGALQRRTMEQEVGKAQLSADRDLALARVDLAQSSAQELYNEHKIKAQQEASLLQAAEITKYNAEKKSLEGELALAEQLGEKAKAQTIALHSQLEQLELKHQAEMDRIKGEGARKATADEWKELTEQLASGEQIANQKLATEDRLANMRLKSHQESTSQWVRDEDSALQQWYTAQSTIIQKAMAEAAKLYGVNSRQYEQMTLKMEQLDAERANKQAQIDQQASQKFSQYMSQVYSSFNSGVISMMSGQQTLGKAAQQVWNSWASQAITSILQVGEHWIEKHVLMAAYNALFNTQTTAQNTAAATAAIALNSTTNVAKASSDAEVAAGGTFAYWSGIFPPIAPAMAAAALAEGMAFAAAASFDRGGLVAEDMTANVHKGEMVLDPGLSMFVQNAARQQGGGGGNGGSFTYSPTINHPTAPAADMHEFTRITKRRMSRTSGIANR